MEATPEKTRPNIVFLFPDQLRSDFLSCYGAEFIDTPNIDSIASAGTRYENSYSASPVCVPARTALLTGMNAVRNGVLDNFHGIRANYTETGTYTWPQILSRAGYYTASIGKMHFYPWDASHGFQYRVTAEDKRWLEIRDDYYHYLNENGHRKYHVNEHPGYRENKGAVTNILPWEHTVDRFVGNEAVRFINNYAKEGPFAMMVGFPGPHCPYDPPEDFPYHCDPKDMPAAIPEVLQDTPQLRRDNIDQNKLPWNGVDYTNFTHGEKMKIRAHYAGLVRAIDHEVGSIMQALNDNGLLENTIVILSSDHGDYLGDHNLIGKASFYETCMRVPMLISGPGIPESVVVNELVELRDVTSTILTMAGEEIPPHMDSRPLPDIGITSIPARDRIFGMLMNGWMNYDGKWKLSRYASGETTLFDLEADPTEQVNLATDPNRFQTIVRMDQEMSAEIMESVRYAVHDRLVDGEDMFNSQAFGREGWQRPWPAPIDFLDK